MNHSSRQNRARKPIGSLRDRAALICDVLDQSLAMAEVIGSRAHFPAE
jgi:hypothetical protein